MRHLLHATLLSAALLTPAAAHAQTADLGERYVAHLESIWAEGATERDVEELGGLLADSAVYTHPRAGVRIEGRRRILDAMAGFLGSTRNPEIRDLETLVGVGVVVVGFDLEMETRRDGAWHAVRRRQVVVLETEDGLVTRVADHW